MGYCPDCRFAFVLIKDKEMLCRRFPPTIFRDAGYTKTEFPTVGYATTCGEWKAEDRK